ncbi:MAG: hypothetical protein JSW72_01830 [Candidatus Bathyarchaeota archaeon]|nr:MAG: hypothetical protein JSW72_01830 [Candidatus Bathyarchaeota archaeon]
MGLFNANAPLASDLNLLLQVFIFILLVGGVVIAKFRRGFNRHGTVMGIAVFLNTISMAIVMIPSLLGFRGLFSAPFSDAALIVFSHSIMGTVVEILGIWLVGVWLINKIRACAKRKNVMRITVILWLIELLVGIYIYIMLYLPI